MRLVGIKQRLVDEGVFARVAGAVQLAAAIERKQFRAEAYVATAKTAVGANSLMNGTAQQLIETIAVCFWKVAPNDPTGEQSLEAIEDQRDTISAALLGWTPDDDHSPFLYAGGEPMEFVAGAALWADYWTTESYRRNA